MALIISVALLWNPLQQVHVLPVLKAPELDAGPGISAEQRGRITTLALLATLLLMQPRIQLAF